MGVTEAMEVTALGKKLSTRWVVIVQFLFPDVSGLITQSPERKESVAAFLL